MQPMPVRFLDTNVLLRYFTRDDEQKASRALALLTRVERGEEKVETSTVVVFETVYTLQRFYGVPRHQIRDLVLTVIQLRGVRLPNKRLFDEAFTLYVDKNVSLADAYNAVYMESRGLSEIYTWDTDFDRLPDVRRVEPHQ